MGLSVTLDFISFKHDSRFVGLHEGTVPLGRFLGLCRMGFNGARVSETDSHVGVMASRRVHRRLQSIVRLDGDCRLFNSMLRNQVAVETGRRALRGLSSGFLDGISGAVSL